MGRRESRRRCESKREGEGGSGKRSARRTVATMGVRGGPFEDE